MSYKIFHATIGEAHPVPLSLVFIANFIDSDGVIDILKATQPNVSWFSVGAEKTLQAGEIAFESGDFPAEMAMDLSGEKHEHARHVYLAGVQPITMESLDAIVKVFCRFDEREGTEEYFKGPLVENRHDRIMEFIRNNLDIELCTIRHAYPCSLTLRLPPLIEKKQKTKLISDSMDLLINLFPWLPPMSNNERMKCSRMWKRCCSSDNRLAFCPLYYYGGS